MGQTYNDPTLATIQGLTQKDIPEMKLSYEEPKECGEVVAEAFHMEDSTGGVCLNFYNTLSDDKVVTLYYDGNITVQNKFNLGNCSLKKFYKGDSVTITF